VFVSSLGACASILLGKSVYFFDLGRVNNARGDAMLSPFSDQDVSSLQ